MCIQLYVFSEIRGVSFSEIITTVQRTEKSDTDYRGLYTKVTYSLLKYIILIWKILIEFVKTE